MSPSRAAVLRILAACAILPVFDSSAAARAQAPHATTAAADTDSREILVILRLSPDHFRPNTSYGGAYGDHLTISARHRLALGIARRHGLNLVETGWPMPLLGMDCYVMRVPPDEAVAAAIAQMSRDPAVAWSEPMQIYRAQGGGARGADPLFAVQPSASAWRLAELHRVATGRGITVAVIDSRIEVNHPDLSGQFVADQDLVGDHARAAERHGTAVAGVIAAKAGNGVGIAGVAPDARLMALRACWQSGDGAQSTATLCNSLSLAKAIHFAIEHGAAVINLSLTGPPDRLLRQLLGIAMDRGISVVAACDPALPKCGFPASEPGVIAVAIESLALFPPGVYGAPGRDVPTTQPGGKWYLVTGSSYAAAHVSGLIALVREDRMSVPRPMLVAAQPTSGIVDACATLSRAAKPCECSCAATAQIAVSGR